MAEGRGLRVLDGAPRRRRVGGQLLEGIRVSAAVLPGDAAGVAALSLAAAAPEHGIASQALLTAPGLRATLFRFASGQELSEHTSPARVLVQVMAGTCEFSVAGQVHLLRPGELMHLPPHAPHAVRAPEDLTLLVVQATPPAK
ncbi:MAG: cupin domain-containing protein [Opitutus sp.]|nr:cupin domain-containing protein [Opitutus sp.]